MCAIKRCRNSRDYRTLLRRSSPIKQRSGNLSSWSRHSWSGVDGTARHALSSVALCLNGKWVLPFLPLRTFSLLFSLNISRWFKYFCGVCGPKKKRSNSTKWWATIKKKKIEGTPAHHGYFHPEKWNIKHVHYTLNLQLFLIAHGHFPIFPALLLARRSGPWEKSLFYYLNPCTGAEPGESSHVC